MGILDPKPLTKTAADAIYGPAAQAASPALKAKFLPTVTLGGRDLFKLPFYTAKPQIVGFDEVDGILFYVDQNGLYASTTGSYGQAMSANKGYPLQGSGESNPAFKLRQVLRFKGNLYCLTSSTAANAMQVYKAAPASSDNTAFTWTLVHTGTTGSTAFFEGMATDGNTLLVADYGDPVVATVKTAKVFRTTDGTTWTTAKTFDSTYRHVHCMKFDPFNPGHVWLTNGDGPTPCIFKSTDSGVTWTGFSLATSGFQSCQISFTEDYVYLGPDADYSTLFVMDREGTVITHGAHGDHRRLHLGQDEGMHRRGGVTSGSPTLTDFYDNPFTAEDIGCRVFGTGIPNGTTIIGYTSQDTVTMSANAGSTAANYTLTYVLQRHERPNSECFAGVVDPDTGIYYGLAQSSGFDATYRNGAPLGGNRNALFYVPHIGAAPVLLDVPPGAGNYSPKGMLIAGGRLHYGCASRPLITREQLPVV